MDTGLETKVAFGDFMQAFEAFKDANDERLAQIEKRMGEDAVTADKVERIGRAIDQTKARIDELTLKAKRPPLAGDGDGAGDGNRRAHAEAFAAYVRKGDAQVLFEIEAKSMSVASGADGGYLVPSETETEIGRKLAARLNLPFVGGGGRAQPGSTVGAPSLAPSIRPGMSAITNSRSPTFTTPRPGCSVVKG